MRSQVAQFYRFDAPLEPIVRNAPGATPRAYDDGYFRPCHGAIFHLVAEKGSRRCSANQPPKGAQDRSPQRKLWKRNSEPTLARKNRRSAEFPGRVPRYERLSDLEKYRKPSPKPTTKPATRTVLGMEELRNILTKSIPTSWPGGAALQAEYKRKKMSPRAHKNNATTMPATPVQALRTTAMTICAVRLGIGLCVAIYHNSKQPDV